MRYKGGSDYVMCLRQITDGKMYSLHVAYSTYSLFEKGDTLVFKLNPEQIYTDKQVTKDAIVAGKYILTSILAVATILFIISYYEERRKDNNE